MKRLTPYSAYKDSGVPWLGEAPEHWEVRRIKTLFREKDKRSGDGNRLLLSLTRAYGLVPHAEASNRMASADDLSKYKVCRPGDLVMNRMQAWSGMFARSSHEGLVSPDYSVFAAIGDSNVKYFEQLFKTPTFVNQFGQRSKGIGSGFNRLYTPEFGAVPCTVPPPSEQSAIVRFLDHTDRRIRRYISAKKKLIALLNEQKQATILRAVTRGLDPNVRLKPSGVEWLGEVPEHWHLSRVRNLVSHIDQGVSPQAEAQKADENSWGVLKAGCINGGVFRDLEHKRLPAGFVIDPRIVVHIGDILVSRGSGSPKLVGSVGRVKTLGYRLILSDKTFRLNLREPELGDFLVLAMNSRYYRTQVEQAISGAEGLANNLPLSSLRSFGVALPPSEEAQSIAKSVVADVSGLDDATIASSHEIDLMREYQTRLIADVVTGKLDVRAEAARLPEDTDEPEPLHNAEALTEIDVDDDLEQALVAEPEA